MSGQLQTIWETLGIEPTADKRIIRHAYACKCREFHPEDHPEKFRLLHQSYEQALDWADKKKEPHTPKRGGENESFSHGISCCGMEGKGRRHLKAPFRRNAGISSCGMEGKGRRHLKTPFRRNAGMSCCGMKMKERRHLKEPIHRNAGVSRCGPEGKISRHLSVSFPQNAGMSC